MLGCKDLLGGKEAAGWGLVFLSILLPWTEINFQSWACLTYPGFDKIVCYLFLSLQQLVDRTYSLKIFRDRLLYDSKSWIKQKRKLAICWCGTSCFSLQSHRPHSGKNCMQCTKETASVPHEIRAVDWQFMIFTWLRFSNYLILLTGSSRNSVRGLQMIAQMFVH